MDVAHGTLLQDGTTCICCSSYDVEQLSGHLFRCNNCGSMFCESCSD